MLKRNAATASQPALALAATPPPRDVAPATEGVAAALPPHPAPSPCARALSREVRKSVRRNRGAAHELEELLPRRTTEAPVARGRLRTPPVATKTLLGRGAPETRTAASRTRTPPGAAKTPSGRSTPETQTTADSGYSRIEHFFDTYTNFSNHVQMRNRDPFLHTENDADSATDSLGSAIHSSRLPGDILSVYGAFKAQKATKNKKNKDRIQDALDCVQFCGLYFCGVDVFCEDDEREDDSDYDILRKTRTEQRREEAEKTFLGKIIQVGDQECWCGD